MEHMYSKNTREFLSCTRVFHKRKIYMELSFRQKVIFLSKDFYSAFVPLLLPRICRLDGTLRALSPPCNFLRLELESIIVNDFIAFVFL